MTIIEVRKSRGRRYLVRLTDDENDREVYVDMRTWDESSYRIGARITDEELQNVLDRSEHCRAREKALYLLSLRSHSRKELEKKLKREASSETAAEVAGRMEEVGLLNDEEYAHRLARDLMIRKHYPKRRVVQELCVRGVERTLAAQAAEEVDSDDVQQALELLQKKQYNKQSGEERRQKMAASLARFGFDGATIRRAMEEFPEADEC